MGQTVSCKAREGTETQRWGGGEGGPRGLALGSGYPRGSPGGLWGGGHELDEVVGVLAEEGPRRHPSMGLWHIGVFTENRLSQAGTGHTRKKAGPAHPIG